MKKWIAVGVALAFNADATLVMSPDKSYVILSRGTAGYTVSSLSGEGNTVVQRMPNGYILLESETPPTFIYDDKPALQPVVPINQELDMEISE